MKNYLCDRKERVKTNSSFSNRINILYGVLQGSILSLLLFNILLCDLFFFLPNIDISSYADNKTPYVMNKSANEVARDIKIMSE